MLKVDYRVEEHRILMALRGDLVIETVMVLEDVLRALPRDGRPVQVDCAGLQFVDSSGVGALLRVWRDVASAGGRMQLSELGANFREVLDVLGILPLLTGTEGTADG